jgi:LPS export ABC transporter protein LptC
MTKRFNVRNLLALAIVLIAVALTFVVIRNFKGVAPEEMLESLPGNVDLSLKQINYTETREGKRRWTLVADSAAHTVENGITRIENIHMTFYDEDMGDVVLTAERGEMQSDSREVKVRGDVVVRNPQGYSLYTESLLYREAERMISTEEPVRMVSEKMEVTGVGMRLDVQDHTLVLLSDIQARLVAVSDESGMR